MQNRSQRAMAVPKCSDWGASVVPPGTSPSSSASSSLTLATRRPVLVHLSNEVGGSVGARSVARAPAPGRSLTGPPQAVGKRHRDRTVGLSVAPEFMPKQTSCVIHEGPGDVKRRFDAFDFRSGGLVVATCTSWSARSPRFRSGCAPTEPPEMWAKRGQPSFRRLGCRRRRGSASGPGEPTGRSLSPASASGSN